MYLKVADTMKEACFNLALMSIDGIGCEKDIDKAISYYEKTSMMGDTEAMLALGNLYDEGKEVAKDKLKALHYYQMAADKDDSHGSYNAGRLLLEQDINNVQEALYYLEIASEKGIGMASLTISNLYYYGVGIQKDIDQAIDYCKLAIKQGTNEGYNNLGLIYSDRSFAGFDYQKAFSFFEEEVKRQVYLAYYNLGILYEYGLGVYKDYKKAVELFKIAAEHGVNQAIGALIRAVKEYKDNQSTA